MTFACRALQVTRKVDILTPLGALYYNTGRYEEALQVYKEAATLQPDSTDIWLALVSRHTHQHVHVHTQISSCSTSTPFAPHNAGKTQMEMMESWNICGCSLGKPHIWHRHQSICLLQPHTLSLSQAQVLAMAGRNKEAEKMTLEIISREDSCIECYRLLSAIYSKRGNYTEVGMSLHTCVLLW